MGVHVNSNIGHYFQMRKELKKHDFISPLLFNIIAVLIGRKNKEVRVHHFVEGGVSIL
jgi:hypothetical protein